MAYKSRKALLLGLPKPVICHLTCQKLVASLSLDQGRGRSVNCSGQIDKITNINESLWLLTSKNIYIQVNFDMMQKVIVTCHIVNMGFGNKRIPSLLDSGSQVTLIYQRYFVREVLPNINPSSREKAKVLQLFQLIAADNGKLSMFMYVKLNIKFWGLWF